MIFCGSSFPNITIVFWCIVAGAVHTGTVLGAIIGGLGGIVLCAGFYASEIVRELFSDSWFPVKKRQNPIRN